MKRGSYLPLDETEHKIESTEATIWTTWIRRTKIFGSSQKISSVIEMSMNRLLSLSSFYLSVPIKRNSINSVNIRLHYHDGVQFENTNITLRLLCQRIADMSFSVVFSCCVEKVE